METQEFNWTGTYISGSRPCAIVRFAGPTANRGSRWLATIKRDSETVWRGSAPFSDGPIAAALKAAAKSEGSWQAISCHSVDSDTYVIGF
jgi:hypothetical protein